MSEFDFQVMDNGNLKLLANEEGRETLAYALEEGGENRALHEFLAFMLDDLHEILPEWIGALTRHQFWERTCHSRTAARSRLPEKCGPS